MEFKFTTKKNKAILALGGESAGNFSVFSKGEVYFSEDFGDLLLEKNLENYKKSVLGYLKNKKLIPEVILTDLHPLFHTTLWGEMLAKKYKAKRIQVQHHYAHIFSAIGDRMSQSTNCDPPATIYALAMDGTGLGTDGKIWGGEVFEILNCHSHAGENTIKYAIERIGHLENQTLLGGELAIQEPARMLIGILNNFLTKSEICNLTKKYYSKNEFEVIFSQLEQNFNCLETSSTGRILDAVSLLLDFCGNERRYKHEPIDLLEKNSTKPYTDIKPKITLSQGEQVLSTTFLFEYLIKNLHKDKGRLAATAQLYIAEGLSEIIEKNIPAIRCQTPNTFITGGIANNKIISAYLISKGTYASNSIPRGDAGLSFGQVIYYLLYF